MHEYHFHSCSLGFLCLSLFLFSLSFPILSLFPFLDRVPCVSLCPCVIGGSGYVALFAVFQLLLQFSSTTELVSHRECSFELSQTSIRHAIYGITSFIQQNNTHFCALCGTEQNNTSQTNRKPKEQHYGPNRTLSHEKTIEVERER